MFVPVSLWSLSHQGTKGESIIVPLTSCLTGLVKSNLQIKTKNVSCHTADSKPVKKEVNGTVILPPLVFPENTEACIVPKHKLSSFFIGTRFYASVQKSPFGEFPKNRCCRRPDGAICIPARRRRPENLGERPH